MRPSGSGSRFRPPSLVVAASLLIAAALLGGCGNSEVASVAPPDTSTTPQDTSSGPPIFQEGNAHSTAAIVPRQYQQLAQNRVGDMFPLDPHDSCPPSDQDWSFTHVGDLSLKWARLSVDRMEWGQAKDLQLFSRSDINVCEDSIVTLLAQHDITVMHTIVYWDSVLDADQPPDYTNPTEVQRYLDYADLIVQHFKGRVQYYEILNEAIAYVQLPDYLALIHRVVPIIRADDPEAKIVVGGSTNLLDQGPRDYLFGVLESDVMPLVDGVAIHPMYGPSPEYDDVRQYYYDYPSLVQQIKDTAAAHGFTGEYFAEEMVWRTAENAGGPDEPWLYTDIQAAKYYGRGVVMNLGLRLWAGVGGENYDQIQPIPVMMRNLGTALGGATAADLPVDIRSGSANYMTYGFALADGGKLVAVWTNDAAVDDDTPVQTDLAFPGLSGWQAVGVDPLLGLQQRLNVSSAGDTLLVQGLLVPDYPRFIRLEQ
jgi:Glycosyl hydrolase family 1